MSANPKSGDNNGTTSGAIKPNETPPSTGSATTSVGSSGNHGQTTQPQATTQQPSQK